MYSTVVLAESVDVRIEKSFSNKWPEIPRDRNSRLTLETEVHAIKLVTDTDRSINRNFVVRINNFVMFETITSWMVSASRSSHPNLRRRDRKLSSQEHFKMVHSFTTVCERLNITQSQVLLAIFQVYFIWPHVASHVITSIFLFFFWTFGINWPARSEKCKMKLEWP